MGNSRQCFVRPVAELNGKNGGGKFSVEKSGDVCAREGQTTVHRGSASRGPSSKGVAQASRRPGHNSASCRADQNCLISGSYSNGSNAATNCSGSGFGFAGHGFGAALEAG